MSVFVACKKQNPIYNQLKFEIVLIDKDKYVPISMSAMLTMEVAWQIQSALIAQEVLAVVNVSEVL